MIKQIEDDYGRIDILINHASVEPHVPVLDMDEWEWHRVLDVNLTSAFLTMQSVGRVMREQGHGVIVNVIGEGGRSPHAAAYSASMAGLFALTRAVAVELEPFGIHVHCLASGIPESARPDSSVRSRFVGAVLQLCVSTLYGQIVNVEER